MMKAIVNAPAVDLEHRDDSERPALTLASYCGNCRLLKLCLMQEVRLSTPISSKTSYSVLYRALPELFWPLRHPLQLHKCKELIS